MSAEFPISEDSGQGGSGEGDMKAPPAEGASSPTSGRFGGYELLGEIARGGMGVVYKARQLVPDRIVALKTVLAAQLTSEAAWERFRIEAEAAASLTHPNIVPIYELREVEGVPCFSMPLIEGENLRQWNDRCRERNVEWMRKAAALMAKIARAVHYAHQHGVLHRDIKPSNILVDSGGEPYLTDFGLAKLATRGSDLTVSGAVVGTPEYMSPEQARGETKHLTTAADVFSLGAVFYDLLTGQPPFHGHTDFETRRRVAEEEVTRPSAINRTVNRDVQTICLKCLEKDPRRRYPSAEALAQDLDRWLRHEPIQARPAGPATRAMKWARRNWAVSALAGMGLVVLAVYTVTTTISAARLRRALAESLLHEGEALAASQHPAGAKDRLQRSRSLALQTKTTTLPAELSLADIYRFSPPPLATLRGHRGKVTCVAVGSDQRTLVSGGDDGTIRTWSWPLGRQETVWDAHPGGVLCLALSPSGQFCVSGGMDKKIRIWEARKATLVRTIEVHREPVSAVCFAPSGDTFASASWDRTIRLWRLSSGKEVQVIQTDFERIPRVGFSADGRQMVAGSRNRGFGIWKLDDPGRPAFFVPTERGVTAVCAPTGNWILHGNNARGLAIGSLADGGWYRGTRLPSAVTDVAFLPSGKRAIAGTADGSIAVVDIVPKTPAVQLMLSEHEAAVTAVAAFADGRLTASSSEDGTIRIWDSRPAEMRLEMVRPITLINAISSVVFSSDSLLFLTAGHGGEIELWDAVTGSPLLDYRGHEGVVLDGAFSPDGKRMVSCGQDGTVRIWDVAAGTEIRRFRLEHRSVCCVGFSADGSSILGGEGPADYPASEPDSSEWFKMHVWETETGRERCQMAAHRGGVFALAVSPDGRAILTGGRDGKIKVWDPASWRERACFDADRSWGRAVAFTKDGSECVSAGPQRALRFWNALAGKEIKCLRIKEDPTCLSVCETNSLVLAGMDSGNMSLWNFATGRELHTFIGERSQGLSAVALAPNGKMAISAGAQGGVMQLWHLDSGATWLRLEEAASKARATLQQDAHDAAALRALGEWYQFRSLSGWAQELFEQARSEGADVSSLSLARCYWQGGRLEPALGELQKAAKRKEAPDYYLRICSEAIKRQMNLDAATNATLTNAPIPGSDDCVCQPGPSDGKDIWTTSVFSGATGGDTPGGGMADECLRVGGWGDCYLSLLQFNLAGMPTNVRSAVLYLHCETVEGGGTPMYLDRITQPWDWRTSGTGRDHERLWWEDRPQVSPWRTNALPPATPGRWYAVELTDLYNAWQGGICPNHGLQLRPEKSANAHFNKFSSSRSTNNPDFRPKLIITPRKSAPSGQAGGLKR